MNGRMAMVGRAALVVFSVLMLQVGLVADLRAFGAIGNLMLLAAIAAGSVGGPDRGASFGFAVGLAYDLVLDTPFGLEALSCALAGYASGWAISWVIQPQWWFHIGSAAVVSVAAVIVGVVVARVLGSAYPLDDIVRMALVEAAWSAVLILPARRVLRWVLGEDDPGPYRVALS
jgi:rod shape-determining protein MreD